MDITIFVEAYHGECYSSPFFELFSKEIRNKISVSSSFKVYKKGIFPIFTNITSYIGNFINQNNIQQYGLILDSNSCNLTYDQLEFLFKASFVYFIGKKTNNIEIVAKNINAVCYDRLLFNIEKKEKRFIIAEFTCLPKIYEEILSQKINPQKVYIFNQKKFNKPSEYEKDFDQLKTKLVVLDILPEIFIHMMAHAKDIYYDDEIFKIYGNPSEYNCKDIKSFAEELIERVDSIVLPSYEVISSKINIVCFQPTYLFADLVGRFERIGCVLSDFPLEDASAYIWMRPQEIWHYDYLLANRRDTEIKDNYLTAFANWPSKIKSEQIHKRSIAIHHGTCFEPLYQFCSKRLAIALYDLPKVVGVCEFDECYGPVAEIANPDNFTFFPIGYDDELFVESYIQPPKSKKNQNIKIGIVGRAYGTLNKEQLSKSRLSEPYGYRKGGDQILDIALRLKALQLPAEFHIMGANWEPLVKLLNQYGVEVVYYTRDKDITYKEFPKIYGQLDMLLIAARCEGGPVSAIEALSLGVPVVSTNVGICKYLTKTLNVKNALLCFDYDRKWNIFDTEQAVHEILKLVNNQLSYENKLQIRKQVEQYSTNAWVNYIYNQALLLY